MAPGPHTWEAAWRTGPLGATQPPQGASALPTAEKEGGCGARAAQDAEAAAGSRTQPGALEGCCCARSPNTGCQVLSRPLPSTEVIQPRTHLRSEGDLPPPSGLGPERTREQRRSRGLCSEREPRERGVTGTVSRQSLPWPSGVALWHPNFLLLSGPAPTTSHSGQRAAAPAAAPAETRAMGPERRGGPGLPQAPLMSEPMTGLLPEVPHRGGRRGQPLEATSPSALP